MQVLWLTQVLPHPPDSGPKVRAWHLLETVAREHQVTLLSFVRGDQSRDVQRLRTLCAEVATVPIDRGGPRELLHLARSWGTGRPYLMVRDDQAAMRGLVEQLVAGRRFDVVHADQLNMAQYAVGVDASLRVLDAHNASWLLYRRLQRILPHGPRRLALAREWRLLREYEARLGARFDAVLAVSREDEDALRRAGVPSALMTVVPIALDVQAIRPVRRDESANRILHVGTMYWPPNIDAVQWFVSEVYARIRSRRPDIAFDVVGTKPPGRITRLHLSGDSIHVAGYVADLTPFFERAGVFVVPLRAGAGMRVKILEAMARGVPVVTTRLGCEGIEVEHDRHVLLADSAAEFADATLRILNDRDVGRRLAENGRHLVETRHDYRLVYRSVLDLYARGPGTR